MLIPDGRERKRERERSSELIPVHDGPHRRHSRGVRDESLRQRAASRRGGDVASTLPKEEAASESLQLKTHLTSIRIRISFWSATHAKEPWHAMAQRCHLSFSFGAIYLSANPTPTLARQTGKLLQRLSDFKVYLRTPECTSKRAGIC